MGESSDACSSDNTAMRETSARLIESSTSSVNEPWMARPAAAMLCAHTEILAMISRLVIIDGIVEAIWCEQGEPWKGCVDRDLLAGLLACS